MKKIQWLQLMVFIFSSEFLGSLGSLATMLNIPTWYKGLVKPPLNPPNWIFGPVWTILFALMGIAAYLVWNEGLKKKSVRIALSWFGFQFLLNVLWSFLFFGARSPDAGLVCIVMLWFAISGTVSSFLKVNKTAAYLLIPYFLWVSFAMYLNAGVAFLNR